MGFLAKENIAVTTIPGFPSCHGNALGPVPHQLFFPWNPHKDWWLGCESGKVNNNTGINLVNAQETDLGHFNKMVNMLHGGKQITGYIFLNCSFSPSSFLGAAIENSCVTAVL